MSEVYLVLGQAKTITEARVVSKALKEKSAELGFTPEIWSTQDSTYSIVRPVQVEKVSPARIARIESVLDVDVSLIGKNMLLEKYD